MKNFLINSGFVLAMAILASVGWLNYLNLQGMAEEERWEHHTFAVSRDFHSLISALEDAESGERDFVITGKEEFLPPYFAARDQITRLLVRLRGLAKNDNRHEDYQSSIELLIEEKLALAEKTVTLRKSAGFQAAYQRVVSTRGKELMDAIRRQVTAARQEEDELLQTLNTREHTSIKKAHAALIVGSSVSLTILFLIFLLLKREISQRVKTEEELRRHQEHLEELVQKRTVLLEEAKREAESANLVKSEFLANMSHEMRTPLTGIMGTIDVMLSQELTRKDRHLMEMAKSSAEALKSLINDILDFSRFASGMMSCERQPFALHACVNSVVAPFALQAEAKGLRFRLEIDRTLPERVVGDEGRLRQVLEKLLGNALKFTAQGEIDLFVQAAPDQDRREREQLLFIVRDTGAGIPPESMASIFELFTQADISSAKKFAGVGLGLALTKQIIETLGGEIRVESRPGEGSRFTFSLPLPAAKTDPAASFSAGAGGSSSAEFQKED